MKVLQTVLALTLGAATIVMGFASAQMFAVIGVNTELAEKMGGVNARLDGIERDLTQHGIQFTSLNKTTDAILARVEKLSARQTMFETDPVMLLSKWGIKTEGHYTAAFVKGDLYVFPGGDLEEAALVQAGFVKEPLSPVLVGYRPPQ